MSHDWEVRDLLEMSDVCSEIRTMTRVFCARHGAVSSGELFNVNREAFNELCEAAESLLLQLGEDEQ